MLLSPRLTRFAVSYRFLVLAVCLGVVLSLSATSAWAQTSQVGTVAGQVTDEQNAAIPGTAVKLTDVSTNAAITSTTNNDGRYVFGSVPPGKYNISFMKQGFSTYDVNGQAVDVGQVLTLNAVLKVGSTATTVEVSASAGAQLQTMNATVGNTLSGQSLLLLPNLGRDVTSLAVLQPATTPSGYTAGSYNDAEHLYPGWRQHHRRYGRKHHRLPDELLRSRRKPGRQYSLRRDPDAHREHRRVQGFRQQPDLRFQQFVGRADPDGDQARNQPVSRLGIWMVFRYQGRRGQFLDQQPHAVLIRQRLPALYADHFQPSRPLRRRDRRSLSPKPFLGGKWFFFFNYEGLRFPNAVLYSRSMPSPCSGRA